MRVRLRWLDGCVESADAPPGTTELKRYDDRPVHAFRDSRQIDDEGDMVFVEQTPAPSPANIATTRD